MARGMGGYTHILRWAAHNQEENRMTEALPKEQGSHQSPQSGGLWYQEDKLLEHLTVKASGAYFLESKRAVGDRLHS